VRTRVPERRAIERRERVDLAVECRREHDVAGDSRTPEHRVGQAARPERPPARSVERDQCAPSGVVIAKDRFTTKDGTPSWPRGATIRYSITNKTKQTLALKIWIATTKPIAPGGHTFVVINWIYRGRYFDQELRGTKLVGAARYLVIGESE
jgi:hypothetical protein